MTGYARISFFLALLFLPGCEADSPFPGGRPPGPETRFPSNSFNDPCAFALTPHSGEDDVDLEIVRFQTSTTTSFTRSMSPWATIAPRDERP